MTVRAIGDFHIDGRRIGARAASFVLSELAGLVMLPASMSNAAW